MEEDLIGVKIAEMYEVQEYIGGRVGAVWKAYNPITENYVAIKTFPPTHVVGKARERFNSEALIQKRLEHTHIVPVIDAGIIERGDYEGTPFIIMKYMENGSLEDKWKARGRRPYSSDFVTDLSMQVLSALDYVHINGVKHCDIHPGNILFDENGIAYVSDFELAQLEEEETASGYFHLSLRIKYVDPKLLEEKIVRFLPQHDLFSWSIIMFELLAGKTPHPGAQKRLTEINPKVPARLEEIIAQGMSENPQDRFPVKTGTSAAAMRNELYKLTPEGREEEVVSIMRSYDPKVSSILERKVSSETLSPKDINDLYSVRGQLHEGLARLGISSVGAKKRASGIEKLITQREEGDAAIIRNTLKKYRNAKSVKDVGERKRRAKELGNLAKVAHAWGFHKEDCLGLVR